MKWILIYIENYEQFLFFNRFKENLNKLDYNFIAVTQKPSILVLCKLHKYKCELLYEEKSIECNDLPIQFSELYKNLLFKEQISNYYQSVMALLKELVAKYNCEFAFIYNGFSIPTYALSYIAKRHNIKALFFELANLPNKMFVATDGVNAHSNLYKKPSILESFPTTEEEYSCWKASYLQPVKKRSNRRRRTFIRALFFIFDYSLFKVLNLPKSGEYDIIKKIKSKFIKLKTIIIYDEIDIKNCKYIFFPLQVHNDTQLVFNSEVDNISAILQLIKIAKNRGLDLLIKPHPMERNTDFLKEITTLRTKYGFYLVDLPVKELIENSFKVVTINSTIGLEAMIMDKEVQFLGKSFYPKLEGEYLRNYIMEYLIDIEYNSNERICLDVVKKILSRYKFEKD